MCYSAYNINAVPFCLFPQPSNARYTVTIVQQTIGVGPNAKNVTDAYSISPDFQNFTGNASMFLKVEKPAYLDYDNPDYRIHTVVVC